MSIQILMKLKKKKSTYRRANLFAILTIDAFDGRQCPSVLSVIRTISLFVSFMKKKVSLKKKKANNRCNILLP